MNNQDIKQALQELEPEEAAQIALSTLRNSGYVVKAWCRDDVLSVAEQDPEFDGYSETEQTKIIDHAVDSSYFQNLEDCTDQDWDAVSMAIDDAMMVVLAGRA